ncbi:ATP-dependent Lon protease [Bradyrhizobium algeriense]|uniref:ATP-dependent Lon protease n=1 Tax=Bradyrhizobium algeriense TaxID=634784 RepID=A0ABU8BNP7_9BRAD
MADSAATQLSSTPLPVELLWQRGWPLAAQVFWSRIAGIAGVPRDDLAAHFWSEDKDRCKQASRSFADLLFAAGHGEEALAALMLAADPAVPQSFEIVLPQLAYAIEHFWDWPVASITRDHALQRLFVWWRAARGDFAEDDRSIFLIIRMEMLEQTDSSEGLPTSARERTTRNENERSRNDALQAPGLVVMAKGKATKLTNDHSEFRNLIDAHLPLVIARDLTVVRATLIAEYPHATTAVDLILRPLREGEPVRPAPVLLLGPAGSGKSRLVRRTAELLGLPVYRYDGSSASDNMFGGSPRAWGNSTPSAPARAVNQTRVANCVVMVDELEKAGTASRNGRLWNALLPFLERETSCRYRDVSLDCELDLSWISHMATANSVEGLPDPLKDRYRIIRVPAPTLKHLAQLAAGVLKEIAIEAGETGFVQPLANDELAVIARAWEQAGLSLRNLQKIIAATLEVRNATAVRH